MSDDTDILGPLRILDQYASQRRKEFPNEAPGDITCSVSLEELQNLLVMAADAQIAGAGLEQAIKDLAGLREAVMMIGTHLVEKSERLLKKYRQCEQRIHGGGDPGEFKMLSIEQAIEYRDRFGSELHTTNGILGTVRTIARVKANVDF